MFITIYHICRKICLISELRKTNSKRETIFIQWTFRKKLILLLLLKPRFVIFSWEIEDLKVCNVSMSCWEKQIFRNDHLCIFYTWWNIITISIWALLQPNKMYQPSNCCAQQTELIFLFLINIFSITPEHDSEIENHVENCQLLDEEKWIENIVHFLNFRKSLFLLSIFRYLNKTIQALRSTFSWYILVHQKI